jgi:membrane dipeptidase
MLVFDAHLDLAWNALDWNRDLRLTAAELRQRERDQNMTEKGRGQGTVTFPELRRGKVGIFIATLLARLYKPGTGLAAVNRYSSMPAAYGAAYGQLAYYRGLEQEGVLRWIKDWPTLESHVRAWQNGGDKEPLGFILSMEGADPVLTPGQVEEWFNAGLRIIGPAHYGPSPYARGHDLVGGLFPQGPALLKEMERVGMILDVTHLSDQCFFEAIDIYGGPILASHHNCRALVDNPRQLMDEQIKRIVQRGGVIGTALDTWMMVPGWMRGQSNPKEAGAKLEIMVNHIDHVCQLAGSTRHAAIGTDLDGGFGREQSPYDLDTIADLQHVPDMLRRRGYKEQDVEQIMYGNWVRFFREAWKK